MAQSINKKALIDLISEKTNNTKKETTEIVNTLFDVIADNLKEGNKVDISGFGKFEVKERKARTGINPATKETIEIPASNAISFKVSKALKEAVK